MVKSNYFLMAVDPNDRKPAYSLKAQGVANVIEHIISGVQM